MKCSPLLILAAGCLFSAPVFAQAPAPGAAAPATDKPAAKPKPLGSTERSTIKGALESMYFLSSMTSKQTIEKLRDETAQKAVAKYAEDLTKLWPVLAELSMASGDKVPVAITPADKAKTGKLNKVTVDAYDAEYLKILSKESKHLDSDFKNLAKSTDPQIKDLVSKWGEPIKTGNDSIEALEKAGGKQPKAKK